MSRSLQPSSIFSMASARDSSTKNSAGPPMPNDVRDASGTSFWTPGSPRSQARLDLVRQLIAQLSDVAGAHQQHDVVGTDDLLERLFRLDEVADVDAVWKLVGQIRGPHARHVVLARAVEVEHEDPVRPFEGAREVVHERAEPRVAMRLKDDDEAPVAQLARGFDGRPHLGRVMRVVVVDHAALEHTEELEAPVRTRKRLQRGRNIREFDAQLERHRGGARRILDVVAAGLTQVEVPEQVDAAVDRKWTDRLGAVGCVMAKAVGDLARLRLQLARQVVVRAQDGEAFFRQAFDEPLEEIADGAHVTAVVGMVELD